MKKFILAITSCLALTSVSHGAWKKKDSVVDYPYNTTPATGDYILLWDAGTNTTQQISIATLDARWQGLDADLTDLADGSLTGTKVGLADAGGYFTTDNVEAALQQIGTGGFGGSFDSTTVNATTWGNGSNASNIWTFGITGTDPTITFSNGLIALSPNVDIQGDLTVENVTAVGISAETITGAVGSGTITASGFNGNLTTLDNTVQEIAQKLDDLSIGASDFDALAAATEADIDIDDVFAVSHDGTEKKITLENMVDLFEAQTWTFTTMNVTTLNVTTLDATNLEIGGIAVTPTAAELNYVDAVTSPIQTQLDAKSDKAMATKNSNAAYTIGTTDADELKGGTIYVTSTGTQSLPAIAAGMSLTIIADAAVVVTVDPNGSEIIRLNGVDLAAGFAVKSTGAIGEILVLTYHGAGKWYAATDAFITNGS